ncbi:MAG TPA: tagaturonate epimerase family protein [Oceanipulchritudo sp.]|nr:tagaturonate epimerase family protein [Oceanipulchritudo sp.]
MNDVNGNLKAVPLGLVPSFGYGDRLGLATPGHLAAHRGSGFAPIFAQQSIREMARTNRTPAEVMEAAKRALAAAGYAEPWGADADHLKTQKDVEYTAAAGFCFFTIDPSEHVVNQADTMDVAALKAAVAAQNADGIYGGTSVESLYLGKTYSVGGQDLTFAEEPLLRAAVKYGRAIAHCEKMAGYIHTANKGKLYEIEVSVDETDSPTSALEHLFFALELRRRGVTVVSLAPRFIGEFEKGIDYKGDIKAFEAALKVHVAIAREFGPYKISVHSGSDKFSIYPIIGRVCQNLLHVKTAGTSYLEALRVVARTNMPLFREIVDYSGGRFSTDKVSYHISVTDADVPGLLKTSNDQLEQMFLNEDKGRQVLHVTFGSVLTLGNTAAGQPFKMAILEILQQNADLHAEVLEHHLGKHLKQLRAG